jgi:hypothetical protein
LCACLTVAPDADKKGTCQRELKKGKKRAANRAKRNLSNASRTHDLGMPAEICSDQAQENHYSPSLYQLSYREFLRAARPFSAHNHQEGSLGNQPGSGSGALTTTYAHRRGKPSHSRRCSSLCTRWSDYRDTAHQPMAIQYKAAPYDVLHGVDKDPVSSPTFQRNRYVPARGVCPRNHVESTPLTSPCHLAMPRLGDRGHSSYSRNQGQVRKSLAPLSHVVLESLEVASIHLRAIGFSNRASPYTVVQKESSTNHVKNIRACSKDGAMPYPIPYRAVLLRILRLRQSFHSFSLGLTWLSIRDLQFKPCDSSNCSADLKTVVLGGPFQVVISKKPVSLLVSGHIEINVPERLDPGFQMSSSLVKRRMKRCSMVVHLLSHTESMPCQRQKRLEITSRSTLLPYGILPDGNRGS